MPITLIEAFACGCTSLSTPVSGAIDIITHGITGFLALDFSEKEYTETLRYFLKVKKQLIEISLN
jgi:glycosyltransferase involved in cell wall biosynthesis